MSIVDITEEEKWQIMLVLGIKNTPENLQELTKKIDELYQSSIYLTTTIRHILDKWKRSEIDQQRISSGLIKADVLEWKPNAGCGIEKYRWQIKWELGQLLGIDVEIPLPFSISSEPLAQNLSSQNLAYYGQFYKLR